MKLKENLASVYARLLPDLSELEVPDERWADCANCHVCTYKQAKHYHTKCCDYHPCLPNYVVGLILNDNSDELRNGRKIIEEQIKNKIGVTPFGIFPSAEYQQKFINSRISRGSTSQEETTAIRCPYFHNGGCSIHKHRTDVCGTSFCISVSLSSGKRFWEATQKLNQYLDKQLSLKVAKAMGFNSNKIPKTLQEVISIGEIESDFVTTESTLSWNEWVGNEIEYFKKCSKLFETIKQEDIERELGKTFQTMKENVKRLQTGFVENEIPQLLRFDENKWQNLPVKIEIDSIEIWILRLFNGKNTTDDVIKKALHLKVGLSKTLRKLINNNVIVEV